MTKASVITLPDGTKIEVSPDLSPAQITAMISALTTSAPAPVDNDQAIDTNSGKVVIAERSIEDIWNSSKRERVALFIRNYLSPTIWFGAKDIVDQQLSITGGLELGETSSIGTYLNRLFENGFLDKKMTTNGRSVSFKITDKLLTSYPEVALEEIKTLLLQH